jgi:hypothetical protein
LLVDGLFRWVLAAVFLLGSPFVALGAVEAYRVHAQLSANELVVGTVVANRLVQDRRDGVDERAYQPEVVFRTRDGATHRFTDGAGSLPADYSVGENVTVLTATEAAEGPRIASWKRLWLVPTLFIVVGLLPGSIAWLVLRRVGRSQS